jgi:RHS repeat-associated protein
MMISRVLLKKIVILLALFVQLQSIMAQDFNSEIFYQYKKVSHIPSLPYSLPEVSDNHYSDMSSPSWRQKFKNFEIHDRIALQIVDSTSKIDSFNYWVKFTLDTFNVNGNHDSFDVWINISYNPRSKSQYIDRSLFQFKNIFKYKASIKVISADSGGASINFTTAKKNFSIRTEIETKRYYLYPYERKVTSLTHTLTGNKLKIQWTDTGNVAPVWYELEWTWLDTFGYATNLSALDYNFLNNSTRVVTQNKNYLLNLAYNGGVVLYRVRRVRWDSMYLTQVKYGHWYPENPSTGNALDWISATVNNHVYSPSHEHQTKNWDYSVVFAEDGLKKETVMYFDGSLRNRQIVTLSYTDTNSLVAEKYYDWQGREALSILPVPSTLDTLKFYRNFNVNTSNQPYSAADFDESNDVSDLKNVQAEPLGLTSGAGLYYSSNNPKKWNENQFIPDAQGFPMTQTLFKPDGSGRPYMQSGVGYVHRIGGGHETKMYYGKPTQLELDQLFGFESGYYNHYKRNATIDPNGQASVNYIDQHGRTIATGLVGAPPFNLDTLDSYYEAIRETDIITKQDNVFDANRNAFMSNHAFTVFSPGEHSFSYKLSSSNWLTACTQFQQCLDCEYQLSFQLNDGFGETIFSAEIPIISNVDSTCELNFILDTSNSYAASSNYEVQYRGDSFTVNLPIGEYVLYKRIEVNTLNIKNKAQSYVDSNQCFQNLDSFIAKEIAKIDTSCTTCDSCNPVENHCESLRVSMLTDLSPGGQYALFEFDTLTNLSNFNIDSTSIYYNHSGTAQPVYQRPTLGNYLSADGSISKIKIGDYSEEKYPQQLTPEQFVYNWQESWANSLLQYHPEYCIMQQCFDTLERAYVYDDKFKVIDNFDTAFNQGYFDPLGINDDLADNLDSFFLNNSGSLNSWGLQMQYHMEHYTQFASIQGGFKIGGKPVQMNIWQLSMGLAFCQDATDELERNVCLLAFSDSSIRNTLFNHPEKYNQFWENYQQLYLQLKQHVYQQSYQLKTQSCSGFVKNIGTSKSSLAYRNKYSWFPKAVNYYDTSRSLVNIQNLTNAVTDSLNTIGICEAQMQYWTEKLQDCPNWQLHKDSILQGFLQVCNSNNQAELFAQGIVGTSDFSTNSSAISYRFNSFDQVLKYYLGSNYANLECNVDLIAFPTKYNQSLFEIGKSSELNDCHCNTLAEDIKLFNGCVDDSVSITTKGYYMLKLFQNILSNNLFNVHNSQLISEANFPGVLNNLLKPELKITDNSTSIYSSLAISNDTNNSNEAFLHIATEPYNSSNSNSQKCNLMLISNPGISVLDITSFLSIQSGNKDTFEFKVIVNSTDTTQIKVVSGCFTHLFQKCSSSVTVESLGSFTEYYNLKYNSSLNSTIMNQLLSKCQAISGGPAICSPEIKAKDVQMMQMLNELLRPSGYSNNSGNRHHIETNQSCWDSSNSGYNYLLNNKNYKKNFFTEFHKYNNIWYEAGLKDPLSGIWTNNKFNQDSFIGGNWIGVSCTGDSTLVVKQCFIGYGDPLNELKNSTNSDLDELSEIDSFSNLYYDWDLEEYMVTAHNRFSQDSIHLSFNTCYTGCKPKRVISKTYTENVNGTEFEVKYSFEKRKQDALMDVLSYLANTDKSTGVNDESALTNSGRTPQSRHYDLSIAISSAKNKYVFQVPNGSGNYFRTIANFPEGESDTMLVAYILDPTDSISANSKCQFNLRRLPTSNPVAFAHMQYFKDFELDRTRVKELIQKGQFDDAQFYFNIKGGKLNSPGDTSWQTIRGWSSCYALFNLDIRNQKGLLQFLPQNFASNCNCLTCPEVKVVLDSFKSAYPEIHTNHSNFLNMSTNYLNSKLGTHISSSEYIAFINKCDKVRNTNFKKPTSDYRIKLSNSSSVCKTNTLAFLKQLNDSLDGLLEFDLISFVSDSSEFHVNFQYLNNENKKWAIQKLSSFKSTQTACSTAVFQENYYSPYDLELFISTNPSNALDCAGFNYDSFQAQFCSQNSISIPYMTANPTTYDYNSSLDLNPNVQGKMYYVNLGNLSNLMISKYLKQLSDSTSPCNFIKLKSNFYFNPEKQNLLQNSVCFKDTLNSTNCKDCETIQNKLIEYQFAINTTDSLPLVTKWNSQSISNWLATNNIKADVYLTNSECTTCSEKQILVCQEPSSQAKGIYQFIQNLTLENKLGYNSGFYSLDTTYHSVIARFMDNPSIIVDSLLGWKISQSNGAIVGTLRLNSTSQLTFNFDFELGTLSALTEIQQTSGFRPKPQSGKSSVLNISVSNGTSNDILSVQVSGVNMMECCSFDQTVLCRKELLPTLKVKPTPCGQELIPVARFNAQLKYQNYRDSLLSLFQDSFLNHCLNNLKDTIRLNYLKQNHHFTLYYYDLAGNLERTVPPKGIQSLSLNFAARQNLNDYRALNDSNKRVFTDHDLNSIYHYNSLNLVDYQITPDAGITHYYYDRLGRMVASQNAKQKQRGIDQGKYIYSYTIYDALGRMVEVGEATSNVQFKTDSVQYDTVELSRSNSIYTRWLAASNRTEITKTYYDEPINSMVDQFFEDLGTGTGQQNLRNRVASTAYLETQSVLYDRATHYSYDIHGNVHTLIQENPDLKELGSDVKSIYYEYELFSGKVKQVTYQSGQVDQFIHRYEYDADNRLLTTQTSLDGVIWDMDAEYKYYRHGPLARVVLGEKSVQGLDYAYTINGWIKGVNSDYLNLNADMGKDGGSESMVAKDAFGYSLTYFTDDNDSTNTFLGDYKSITPSHFLGRIYNSPLTNTSRNLYNGNIKHMVTAIGEFMKNGESPQATVYHYDQLNRLTNMNTYASFNFSSQSWNSGSLSDNYQNSFTYDANGNILTQFRKTAKSSNKVQDQLTYHYQSNTNRLTYVSDAVNSTHYSNDIDDQSAGNYVYDEIGNLVKDKSEEIDTILWTVYGKLKEIRRVDTSSKPWLAFEYNPSGQRAVKIVKPDHNDQLSWIYTYYIYDATGNVMATYTRRNYFDDIGDSSFAFVNDWIYHELGLTDLQDFMESKFNYNGQFMNDWIEYLSTNELAAGVFDEFSPDDFLGWDATLVPAVLSNFAHSPNASPTENDALLNAILSNQQSNFVSSVLNSGIAVLNNALTAILSNDPTDLLLNCMATNNPVGLNSVYVSLGGSPVPPPTNASRIAYIRSFPPPTIASQISAIESISNLQNYFSSCLNSTMIYNSWNSAQPNISFTDLFDAWSGLGDTSLILDVLQNHYSNDAHLRILLKEVRTLQQLYQLTLSSNYSNFVSNSINATSYQDLSFVMYQSSALTFSSYLKLVRTHFGTINYSNMMADIGEWLKFGKDILLQEQHIYGSTRLGMYQSNQLLVKYKYKYSDTLQIYLDSVKFDRDTNRAMRKLSHKQYELTNHLGNVLSMVLDRKSPITSSGGSGGSTTITHYEGDVVFASDYYPFGSPMSWTTSDSSGGRLYSGGGYRYGFNSAEKDNEIKGEGNSYTTEFRQYDPRLGRWLTLDPLMAKYPNQSPYAGFNNNPILFVDPLGLEGENPNEEKQVEGVEVKDNISWTGTNNPLPTFTNSVEENRTEIINSLLTGNDPYKSDETENNSSEKTPTDGSSMFTPAKVYFKNVPKEILADIKVIPEDAKSSTDVKDAKNGKWYETDGLWIKDQQGWLKIPDINTVIVTYDGEKLIFNIETNIWGQILIGPLGKQTEPAWVPDSGGTTHVTDYPFK